MGFTVSFPSLKLTRGKSNGKKSANYGKILKELGNERYSTSKTLDRGRSTDNVYHGYKSGKACMSAIDDVLEGYTVKVTGKDGVVRERKIRNNATVAYSMIIKPPADVVNEWDDETRKKFLSDSMKVLEEICPEIFGGGSELIKQGEYSEDMTETVKTGKHNLLMIAEHFDEAGWHAHCAGMPFTSDGRLSGAEVMNIKTYGKINSLYPERMRELGWDIDKLDLYDAERAKTDPEYKKRRAEQRKNKRHGLSVNDYAQKASAEKAEKARERAIEAKKQEIEALQDLQSTLETLQDTKQELVRAKEEERKTKQKIQDMNGDVYVGDDGKKRYGVTGMRKYIATATDKAKSDIAVMKDEAKREVKEYTIKHKKKAKADAEKTVSDAQDEAERVRQRLEQVRKETEQKEKEINAEYRYLEMEKASFHDEIKDDYKDLHGAYREVADAYEEFKETEQQYEDNKENFTLSVAGKFLKSAVTVLDRVVENTGNKTLQNAWGHVSKLINYNFDKFSNSIMRQYQNDEKSRETQLSGIRKDMKKQVEQMESGKLKYADIAKEIISAEDLEEAEREAEREFEI